jgi:hypothetical protein
LALSTQLLSNFSWLSLKLKFSEFEKSPSASGEIAFTHPYSLGIDYSLPCILFGSGLP